MSVAISDMKFRKSVAVSDTGANGGRKGSIEVLTGVRHNLFPRVTKAERTTGITRYRKEFFCNENSADEVAYASLFYLEAPSNAGDRYYLGLGTKDDTQADIMATPPAWVGAGQVAFSGSLTGLGDEYEVTVEMEANDYEWINGGILHISNKMSISQAIATDVNIGDSVQWSAGQGKWTKIAHTTNITYPKGLYLGSDRVMTIKDTTEESFLVLADNLTENEVIGTQGGATATVALTALANITNGVCVQSGKLPVVTAIIGGNPETATIQADGTVTGFATAGQLNLITGAWVTDITWNGIPDNGTDITISYRDLCYSYSGNTATVQLNEAVPHAFPEGTTFVAGCVEGGDIYPNLDSVTVTSALGTFNDGGTNPPVLHNLGTIDDTITIQFSSATNFSVSGVNAGNMGTGTITSDYSFTNPATGVQYIQIPSVAWGGTFVTDDTVVLELKAAAVGLWLKEEIPAGTNPESYNLLPLGWYCE